MWACTHKHTHTHCPVESKPITSGSVVETKYKLAHAILALIMSQAAVMHRLLDLSCGGSTCGSGERGWEEEGPAGNVL